MIFVIAILLAMIAEMAGGADDFYAFAYIGWLLYIAVLRDEIKMLRRKSSK